MLAEVGLPGRVQRRVAAVVEKQLQLDLGITRSVKQTLGHVPVVGADGLDIAHAIGVLPLGGAEGHQETQGIVVGHLGLAVGLLDVLPPGVVQALVHRAAVGPIGLDRLPEIVVDALVVGVPVLNDQRVDTFGVFGRQTEADRRAIVHQVQRVVVEAEFFGQLFDDDAEVVKGVVKFVNRRHGAVAVTGIIRRHEVELVSQLGDQVAEHMRRSGEAVQQQQGWCIGRSGLAIENGLPIDFNGAVFDLGWRGRAAVDQANQQHHGGDKGGGISFQVFHRSFLLCSGAQAPFGFFDWHIVGAHVAPLHQSVRVKFPMFIAVGAVPLAGASTEAEPRKAADSVRA